MFFHNNIEAGRVSETVGNPSQHGQNNAQHQLSVFSKGEKCAKYLTGVNFFGYRFLNIGKNPKPLNRRSSCPAPLNHSSLLASLHSYLLVLLNKKKHQLLSTFLLSLHTAKCNTVRGQICSAPDTQTRGFAWFPQPLVSDVFLGVVARICVFCYTLRIKIINSRSEKCLIQKQQQAYVLRWFSDWVRVRSNQNLSESKLNLSSINSAKLPGVRTVERRTKALIQPVKLELIRLIRACRRKKSASKLARQATTHVCRCVLAMMTIPSGQPGLRTHLRVPLRFLQNELIGDISTSGLVSRVPDVKRLFPQPLTSGES